MTAQVLPKDEARRIYNALVAKIKDPALAAENRQGALAFAQDILILLDGQIILIDITAGMEEPYKPIDPATTTTPPPVRADRRTASYQEYWDLVE